MRIFFSCLGSLLLLFSSVGQAAGARTLEPLPPLPKRAFLPMLFSAGVQRPPPAPAGLQAELSGSWAQLSWPDASTLESKFHVEASPPGQGFYLAADLPADQTTFTMLLTQTGAWRFRVWASNEAGGSGYSPIARVDLQASPVSLLVVNSSSLPVAGLADNGNSLLPPGESIPPGQERAFALLPGTHQLQVTLGPGLAFYQWQETINLTSGSNRFTITDPSLEQVLTRFSTAAAWWSMDEDYTLDCYWFYPNSTYAHWYGGVPDSSGTYGNAVPFGDSIIQFQLVEPMQNLTGRYYPDTKRLEITGPGGLAKTYWADDVSVCPNA